MPRFELRDGTSNKFWEIALKGATVIVRFGRIGTDGQTLTKTHPSAAVARREHDALVAQKTKKGYASVSSAAAKTAPKPKPATKTAPKPKPATKTAPKPKPVAKTAPKRRIGQVINGHSNYLAILVADATVAASYSGPVNEPPVEDARRKKVKRPAPDDFERACGAINGGDFALGAGKGVVVEIGGCGLAEVHRIGDAIVIPEIYTDEDDVDTEAELDRVIASHPTTKPKLVGTVEVTSGVVVLMGIFEPGAALDLAGVTKRGVQGTKSGVAVAVPSGRYEVWREEFKKEPEGDWGTMPSRVRVVAAGTPVVPGAPIAAAATAGPAHLPTADAQRRLVDPKDEWQAIASVVLAEDGRLFAGENGRHGVAAWGPDGSLLWQRTIRPSTKKASYQESVGLTLAGNELIAVCPRLGELVVLDAKTGKEKRKLKVGDPRSVLAVDDRLIVRTGVTTTVLAYPSLKTIAELDEYVNGPGIAVSPDRKYLAVHGHEWHTFELSTLKHVCTVDADDDPLDLVFTSDGKLVTVDDGARIKVWDPKSGKRLATIDGAKDRSRKPAVNAVDASACHLAIARDDGAVAVIDLAKKATIHRFEKHLVTVPGTGATQLADVAFSKDGKVLWVSAGPKGAPVGLTAYAIP
jgi:predicted DNA-binding WGR domain protein